MVLSGAMRRYLILLLAILVLASVIITGCALGFRIRTTEVYQNDKYGYSVDIPKTWTSISSEDAIGQSVTFRSPNNQMEVTVRVSSELALNDGFSEAKKRGLDIGGITPLELAIRYRSSELTELGVDGKRLNWNEHAVTTFFLVEAKEWKSWLKTHYIVDKGNFYIIEFKVLGYSDSEFEGYRNQVIKIGKSFHIQGSTVINLPEGKTIFDF
jgi:hypothetical protein